MWIECRLFVENHQTLQCIKVIRYCIARYFIVVSYFHIQFQCFIITTVAVFRASERNKARTLNGSRLIPPTRLISTSQSKSTYPLFIFEHLLYLHLIMWETANNQSFDDKFERNRIMRSICSSTF